ncbi:TetR/AcrR family transcriptional regulator [Psychromonas hadalis]|uniref:TetR/AcrR family transcriptional regulator n=1 Tax=Psychromonas hadalis TaxID=211669 RepID=UPI0003B30B91|nr:TetR/AcrR family transcriptional regulator [Psychromonas hadalis]
MKTAKKRGRPNNKDAQLNQELIIYMAKTLMREQGEMPSIRGLARALDVDAMAIYHYFENKNSLLEAILVSLMDSLYFPPKQQPWQDALLLLSESYLTLLNHYAGLLTTLISMPSDGPKTVFTERFNKIIDPLNLPPQKQKEALFLLINFLHGQALLVTVRADSETVQRAFKSTFVLYCSLLTPS